MKKLLFLLLAMLILVCLCACDENSNDQYDDYDDYDGEQTVSNDLIGAWHVVQGGDNHEIIFYDDNTCCLIDGSDTFTAEYIIDDDSGMIFLSDEIDDTEFSFKLVGETLIRYEEGEEDGYEYEKGD